MKNLFKKLNWVQWIDILLLVLLTVFFAFLFYRFGISYNLYKDFYAQGAHPLAMITYGKYLAFSIIAYTILVAFLALVFIREFKKNKEKV